METTPEPPRRPPGPALTPAAAEAFQRAFARPAVTTRAALVLVGAVSAAAFFVPGLVEALMKDNDAIRAGEWWRLLTAGLVHGSVFHLGMNLFVLSNVGGVIERLVGGARMWLVLWGGVAAGSIASFVVNPHPSVGVSGGVFALVGALLAVGLRNRQRLPAPLRAMMVRGPVEVIFLNLALGFSVARIDNAGHLGGLAGGFLLGLVLRLRPELETALASIERRLRWPGGPGGGYGEGGAWHRDERTPEA
jgi:membrane associated rhomboid family serine protease